ncbi:PilW family protein [Bdellovibrio sp. HCB185ZH]|uniref:PilW family protein n=1 Tax=Bdellovibrio sp. HCB185ZH TaxID=3394235 RepID=UPI0039A4B491
MFKNVQTKKLNNKGMTLVELMVVIGLVSVGGYLFATQMYQMTQQLEVIKNRAELEELKGNVRLLALNRAAVNYSATLPENAGIKDCILGTAKCVNGTTVDFSLALPNTKPVASANTFYTYKGTSCASWSAECPFKVSAVAKAVCNRGAPQCIYAGGVYLVTKIEIFPGIANKVAAYGLREVIETSLLPLSGSQEGNKSLKNLTCPTGQLMRGVDLVNNKPICA